MNQNEVRVPDKLVWLAGLILIVLVAASFSIGIAYNKFNSRFKYHEIPLKSGGIALIVPEGWQVVAEWDKHGRPYTETDY